MYHPLRSFLDDVSIIALVYVYICKYILSSSPFYFHDAIFVSVIILIRLGTNRCCLSLQLNDELVT